MLNNFSIQIVDIINVVHLLMFINAKLKRKEVRFDQYLMCLTFLVCTTLGLLGVVFS